MSKYFVTVLLSILLFAPSANAQDAVWSGYRNSSQNIPTAVAQPLGAEHSSENRFYLLRTGFLVEGSATSDGTHYTIKTNFGAMQVVVANVEYIGETRLDIYHYRKNYVDAGNCNDLMKFAEWCLNNGLPDEGRAEYEKALRIAPNDTLREFVRQRLDSLKQTFEANDGGKTTGYHNPFPSPYSQSDAENSKENDAELGQWMTGIPKPVLDAFSRKVQPILVSRCAAADCHGSNSDNQFKINIPRHANGTTTYRNLKSAVQWIDLEHPTASPLLSALVVSHAGVKPPYSVESSQYNNTIQWIQSVGKEIPPDYAEELVRQHRNHPFGRPPEIFARHPIEPQTPIQDIRQNAQQNTLQKNLPGGLHETLQAERRMYPESFPTTFFAQPNSVSVPNTAVAVRNEPDSENGAPIPVQYTPTSLNVPNPMQQASQTNDPFDPNLFNARYHGKVKN